jgi:hypothetical protein
LSFGTAQPPHPFDDQPNIIIFDHNAYFADHPIDLKPFNDIINKITDESTLINELGRLNRSLTVVFILPQWNYPQVQTFVQKNVLRYPSAESFYLFFIDGQPNKMGAPCDNRLVGCYPITSKIAAQTRAACAKVNDLNINYCRQHRIRNEQEENISTANLYAMQIYNRVGFQLAYNERIQREIEQRLLK